VPPAAVIPASREYFNVVAVNKLVADTKKWIAELVLIASMQ